MTCSHCERDRIWRIDDMGSVYYTSEICKGAHFSSSYNSAPPFPYIPVDPIIGEIARKEAFFRCCTCLKCCPKLTSTVCCLGIRPERLEALEKDAPCDVHCCSKMSPYQKFKCIVYSSAAVCFTIALPTFFADSNENARTAGTAFGVTGLALCVIGGVGQLIKCMYNNTQQKYSPSRNFVSTDNPPPLLGEQILEEKK